MFFSVAGFCSELSKPYDTIVFSDLLCQHYALGVG